MPNYEVYILTTIVDGVVADQEVFSDCPTFEPAANQTLRVANVNGGDSAPALPDLPSPVDRLKTLIPMPNCALYMREYLTWGDDAQEVAQTWATEGRQFEHQADIEQGIEDLTVAERAQLARALDANHWVFAINEIAEACRVATMKGEIETLDDFDLEVRIGEILDTVLLRSRYNPRFWEPNGACWT